jgi:hypothetical protein
VAERRRVARIASGAILCVVGAVIILAVCLTPLGLATVGPFLEVCLGIVLIWIGLIVGLTRSPHPSEYETLKDERPISECEAMERNEVNSIIALKTGLMGTYGYTGGFEPPEDLEDTCRSRERSRR